MSDLNAYWLLQKAAARLDAAGSELNRPSEDVVTISVCQQSKIIIGDLLKAFLLLNGKSTEAADLESMRRSCAAIDKRFEKPDLSCMSCHPTLTRGDEQYCTGLERVQSCMEIANEVKELVDEAFRKKENR